MAVANTVAYCDKATITDMNSFIVRALGPNVIIMFVIYQCS